MDIFLSFSIAIFVVNYVAWYMFTDSRAFDSRWEFWLLLLFPYGLLIWLPIRFIIPGTKKFIKNHVMYYVRGMAENENNN